MTLKSEFDRDRERGMLIDPPACYFTDDDPGKPPLVRWRSSAYLIFANWLNYYVYQETPFDLAAIHD
jgi:homoserine O-succinyltransferase